MLNNQEKSILRQAAQSAQGPRPDSLALRRQVLRSMAATAGLAAMGSSLLTACGGGSEALSHEDPLSADGKQLALGLPKSTVSTPMLSCAGSTLASIDIQVCAGPTGAPAGFSLQWMTSDAFNSGVSVTDPVTGAVTVISLPGQWPSNSETLSTASVLCKASFSGNANLARYNLAPGQCVSVRIGELLMDNGASSSCQSQLQACTSYVFRAFAHANNSLLRSAFTDNLTCSTIGCDDPPCDPKVLSQGYWKNHPSAWPVGSSPMVIGGETYTAAELQTILGTTGTGGNGALALIHQVIATRLNILHGAGQAYIDATAVALAAADALLSNKGRVPPYGTAFVAAADAGAWTMALDQQIGLWECPDQ